MSKIQTNYQACSDEQLVAMVQGGEQKTVEVIFERYRNLVRSLSRRFFLVGGDADDLAQEGMMGLHQAILDYDANKKSSFKSFAYLCVYRRIVDAVKAESAKKQEPLLGGSELADNLQAVGPNPEELIILNDEKREFNQKISKILSDFEFKIIVMYMDGLTTGEISEMLGKPMKSIDNAIQRSKRKLQVLKK